LPASTKVVGGNPAAIWPGAEAIVDGRGALRVAPGPFDHTSPYVILGHYRTNLITGTTVSLAANSPIASLRWSDGSRLLLLIRLEAYAQVAAAITAATLVDLEAIIARGFTAADSGGTAIALTGLNQLNRSGNMKPSLVGDLRVATTGQLTAGTRTLDGVGFGFATWSQLSAPTLGATANTAVAVGAGDSTPRVLYKLDVPGQYPVVLSQNEGIILRNSTAGPVTGGIRYAITAEWAEVVQF
jgi:hypothetical protein